MMVSTSCRLKQQLQTWICQHGIRLFIRYNNTTADRRFHQQLKHKPIGELQGFKMSHKAHSDIWLWNSMITRHGKNGRVEDARQVFDKMPFRDMVSWNAMIAAYTQNGMMEDACHLFDTMPQPDVVSWTTMINGYGDNDRLEDAYKLFDKMPERNVVSWNSMITKFVQYGRLEEARELFGRMTNRNVVSWTTMIQGYAQNGRMKDAEELFDIMPERDVVSWTAMITGYAQNGRIEDARRLFDKMPERNVVTWTVMIDGYWQNGRLDDAVFLFQKMPKRNLFSWNVMIAGYAQNGRLEDAKQLFDEMPERNFVSWNTMIAGYAQVGRLEDARQMFDKMIKRNVVSWTTMIAGYAQNGQMEEARHLFDKMPVRDVVSWNAIIAGYAQNCQYEECLKLFSKMQLIGINLNHSSFASILSVCTILACIEHGRQVHDHIIKNGFGFGCDSGVKLANALITMYAGCGSIDDANRVFFKMHKRDVVSWTAMIGGCAQHGEGKRALQLFEQMQLAGIKPDHVTLTAVLFACSHSGLVDEGRHLFDSICRDHFIKPRVEHYACMVDLLGRAGQLKEAEEFINNMPFQPSGIVWRTLLGACGIHAHVGLGQRVAEHVFELNPQNAGAYVLLSNIYAAAGRWDDVIKMRIMMKDRGIEKQRGCSWIEVKNKVCAFSVGDR